LINLKPHNILIIDDEYGILKVLKLILTRKGKNVDTAVNGEEGLKKIQKNSYDLILTDIKMPKISGKEVLAEVKRIKGNTVPVIGMSGTPWLLDQDLFDAVLDKPSTKQKLFATIRKVIPSF